MKHRKIIFGAPTITNEEIHEVVDTLKSGWIGMGPKTIRFERLFARYIGCRYALATSSCTAALHLSLLAAGIQPGDEVITTPLTFAATINSIWHVGAKPVLVDIDPRTLNIDTQKIKKAITKKTKAILPVHFGGLPCDLDSITAIARKHKLSIIEDAAHAVGALYKGKKIGSHGNLTCFSFYANKNITTAEGGMVTTSNKKYARLIPILRLHGLASDAWKRFQSNKLILTEIVYPGYKYNMTDVQASLGIWQLKKIEHFLLIREKYAAFYDSAFKSLPFVQLQYRPGNRTINRHALHLYVLILKRDRLKKNRDAIVRELRKKGIGAAVHYNAVHLHQFYRTHLNYHKGDLPNAEYVGNNILSLPLTPRMTLSDVRYVIKNTRDILKAAQKN